MEELIKIFSDIGTSLRQKYNKPNDKYRVTDFAKAIDGIPSPKDTLRFKVTPFEGNTNEIDENGYILGSVGFDIEMYDYLSNNPMADVSSYNVHLENGTYSLSIQNGTSDASNSFAIFLGEPTSSAKDFVWDRVLITYTYKGVTTTEILTYFILRTDEVANCTSVFNAYKDLRITGPNASKDYATVRLNHYQHSEDGTLYFDVSEDPIDMGVFSFSSTGNISDYYYGNDEILNDYFRVCVNPSNTNLLVVNDTGEHGDYLFYDAKVYSDWGIKLQRNVIDFKTPNDNLFISEEEFRFNLRFWHWEYIFPNYRWVVASEGTYNFEGVNFHAVIYDKSELQKVIDGAVYKYADITDAVRVLVSRKVNQAQIDEQIRLLNQ